MSVVIMAPWIPELEGYLKAIPETVAKASMLAINDSARRALKDGAAEIYRELNFPMGYLDATRLLVRSYATEDGLDAVVAGRGRATSLLRFAEGDPTPESTRGPDAGGVAVRVARGGSAVTFKSGFVLRLRSGKTLTEDNYNLGLAVRLKPGQSIVGSGSNPKRSAALEIFPNVYLLYGPSVAQAFEQVSKDIAPGVTAFLESEFRRQLSRLM